MGASQIVSCFLVVLCCVCCEAHVQSDIRFSNYVVDPNDSGKIVNCGDASMSKFSLDWTPKTIKYGDTVTLNGEFDSVMDISTGTGCYTIWVEGIPYPIADGCTAVTCNKLKSSASFFGIDIKCPLKKGDKYPLKDKKVKIAPKFPLPQGSYKAHANVTTSDGHPYLCVDLQVTVE